MTAVSNVVALAYPTEVSALFEFYGNLPVWFALYMFSLEVGGKLITIRGP